MRCAFEAGLVRISSRRRGAVGRAAGPGRRSPEKGRPKRELYYRGTILTVGSYERRARVSMTPGGAGRLILARQEKGESLWHWSHRRSIWSGLMPCDASRLALVSNQLAGAKRSLGRFEEAIAHEKQADKFTPDVPLYHWMIGRRLKNLGMSELAEKHFQRALQLDPGFQAGPK